MGKQCLNKLNSNLTVGCTINPVGVKNIYLMYAPEVTFTTDGYGNITAASFAAGAMSYLIEGYKQNIQVTTSALSTDAALKLAVSVTFKTPTENTSWIKSILNGSYYALIERNGGSPVIVGVQAPLECSGFDYDSNSNAGMATVTLSAPEGSSGNYLMGTIASAVNTIKSKVGA